ncbi:MAG: hypothetical protein JRN67_11425 [Nitrososphaerota archaeon]|nr:hypothetical protein [Nitrososphaerota archaeon]
MLDVTYSKLERYCKEAGGFDLEAEGSTIVLTFVPSFPEAVEKGDSDPPRVRMTGTIRGDKITFSAIEVDDQEGRRTRDQTEAEMVYRSWLEYIEENY